MTGQARDKEDNQLYRRPQMTGQARDEEEEVETRTPMMALTCNAREHALSWEAGAAHTCPHTCVSRYARQWPASVTEAYPG